MKTLVLWDITGGIAPACGSVDCLLLRMKTLVLWDITGSIAPACGSVDCLLSE